MPRHHARQSRRSRQSKGRTWFSEWSGGLLRQDCRVVLPQLLLENWHSGSCSVWDEESCKHALVMGERGAGLPYTVCFLESSNIGSPSCPMSHISRSTGGNG